MHVIEELLDALDVPEEPDFQDDEDSDESILAVDHSSNPSVIKKKRTLRLCAKTGKVEVLVLVDSGSVGTFVSSDLVQRLQLPLTRCEPTRFITADGSPMVCSH